MVLSDWKRDLAARPRERRWGRGLDTPEFWAIVDYVIERITLPSCEVWMGVAPADQDTPLCWAALRPFPDSVDLLHAYVRRSIREDVELAATMERTFMFKLVVEMGRQLARPDFNPILELKR